jgi:hypothetical protein
MVYYRHIKRIRACMGGGGTQTWRQGRRNRPSPGEPARPLGIKVTLIEPIGYATDWAGPSVRFARELPAYDSVREANNACRSSAVRGNPEAAGPVVLKLVDMGRPPLRIFFGKGAHDMIHAEYGKRLAEWDQFKVSAKKHMANKSGLSKGISPIRL